MGFRQKRYVAFYEMHGGFLNMQIRMAMSAAVMASMVGGSIPVKRRKSICGLFRHIRFADQWS